MAFTYFCNKIMHAMGSQKVITTMELLQEGVPYLIIEVGTIYFSGQEHFYVSANRGKEMIAGMGIYEWSQMIDEETERFLFPLQEHYVHNLRNLCTNQEDWFPQIADFPYTYTNVLDTDDNIYVNYHIHTDIHYL